MRKIERGLTDPTPLFRHGDRAGTAATGLLDFAATWRLVVVRLRYVDTANAVEQESILQLTPANFMNDHRWSVPLKDPQAKRFTWQAQAFARDPAANKVVGPIETDDPLIVLEL